MALSCFSSGQQSKTESHSAGQVQNQTLNGRQGDKPLPSCLTAVKTFAHTKFNKGIFVELSSENAALLGTNSANVFTVTST